MAPDETKPKSNELRDATPVASGAGESVGHRIVDEISSALGADADSRAAAPTNASAAPMWVLTHQPEADATTDRDPDKKQFLSYIRMLFVPTIFTKTLIMFFGLNYAMYPGEGYGYGLAVAICFSICTFSYFVWSQTRTPKT